MLLRVLCIACMTSAARVEVQADATTADVREIDFALISAAADGNATEVKRLLDKGADATAKTKEGETALHTAGISGDAAVVRLLVEAGADLNLIFDREDGKQLTVLDIASGLASGHELVAFLREKGGRRFDELNENERIRYGARKT